MIGRFNVENERNLAVGLAGLLATVATLALAAGIAVNDEGGNPVPWWVAAAAFTALAVAVAGIGVIRPWWIARRVWRENDDRPALDGWRATHAHISTGTRFDLDGDARRPPVSIILCEIRRRGSRYKFVALRGVRGTIPPPLRAWRLFYPEDFEAESARAPLWDHLPRGCYEVAWFAWDQRQHRRVFVTRERFPVYDLGRYSRRARKCAEGR